MMDGGNLTIKTLRNGWNLFNSSIHCPHNGECNVFCASESVGYAACKAMKVYAQETTSSLHVKAIYGGTSILEQCQVHCSPKGNDCKITVGTVNHNYQMRLMRIYVDTLDRDDVSIECDSTGVDGTGIACNGGLIHYGDRICNLTVVDDGFWEPACTMEPTSNPTQSTIIPSYYPTFHPTVLSGDTGDSSAGVYNVQFIE